MSRTWLKVPLAFVQMVSFATAQDTIFMSCWSGKNSEIYRAEEVKSPCILQRPEKKHMSLSGLVPKAARAPM